MPYLLRAKTLYVPMASAHGGVGIADSSVHQENPRRLTP